MLRNTFANCTGKNCDILINKNYLLIHQSYLVLVAVYVICNLIETNGNLLEYYWAQLNYRIIVYH
jgi:hypothetical protein